ncbi:hypothetical protein L1987_44351 [Smallanthus sonchifolius]|uniref:Uncharacterized protein n=1 Tax=Smallanthus sonchifolius TaxID=185202 RepID=A0ACB9GQ93_9ASTR|nr:hypothetical protein L1987_44351 [Smallanthus sonchifolius]
MSGLIFMFKDYSMELDFCLSTISKYPLSLPPKKPSSVLVSVFSAAALEQSLLYQVLKVDTSIFQQFLRNLRNG